MSTARPLPGPLPGQRTLLAFKVLPFGLQFALQSFLIHVMGTHCVPGAQWALRDEPGRHSPFLLKDLGTNQMLLCIWGIIEYIRGT